MSHPCSHNGRHPAAFAETSIQFCYSMAFACCILFELHLQATCTILERNCNASVVFAILNLRKSQQHSSFTTSVPRQANYGSVRVQLQTFYKKGALEFSQIVSIKVGVPFEYSEQKHWLGFKVSFKFNQLDLSW